MLQGAPGAEAVPLVKRPRQQLRRRPRRRRLHLPDDAVRELEPTETADGGIPLEGITVAANPTFQPQQQEILDLVLRLTEPLLHEIAPAHRQHQADSPHPGRITG